MKRIFTSKFKVVLCVTLLLSTTQTYAYNGTGTPEDPYQISSKTDLITLSTTPADWALGKNYILTADIDMGGTVTTPIGTNATPFNGILDGQNHVIRNLSIIPITGAVANDGCGFIGKTTNAAMTVKNIGLINPLISSTIERTGGIIGLMALGTLKNCFILGGTVIGGSRTGGLVGIAGNVQTYSSYAVFIQDCFCSANIVALSSAGHVGGIIGGNAILASGNLSRLNFYGNVIDASAKTSKLIFGPIVGSTYTNVTNGPASLPTNSFNFGIYNASTNEGITEINCTDVGSTTGGTVVSGTQMRTESTFTGFDFVNTWTMLPGGFPVLKSFYDRDPSIFNVTTTLAAGANGTSATTPKTVGLGNPVKLTAVANSGYEVTWFKAYKELDNYFAGGITKDFMISGATADRTINAEFDVATQIEKQNNTAMRISTSNNQINVQLNARGSAKINIYNSTGQLIEVIKTSEQNVLTSKSVKNGIYILSIGQNGSTTTYKVIVK